MLSVTAMSVITEGSPEIQRVSDNVFPFSGMVLLTEYGPYKAACAGTHKVKAANRIAILGVIIFKYFTKFPIICKAIAVRVACVFLWASPRSSVDDGITAKQRGRMPLSCPPDHCI